MSHYDDLAPELLVESIGPVRVLTLNAPERRNAVEEAMHEALDVVWGRLADDDEAGAVVLTGAGKAFSAGGEMAHLKLLHDDPVMRRHSVRGAERLVRTMIDFEVPVVAAVNGPAVGLGATLTLLCDLVVMSETAFLCDPHVSIGLVAGDGGTVLWPQCMSMLQAKEFLLLGDRVPAADCVRLGLANRVTAPESVVPTAVEIAQRLAAQPRQAVRDTKRAMNTYLRHGADLGLDFALAAESETMAGDDVLETIARFAP